MNSQIYHLSTSWSFQVLCCGKKMTKMLLLYQGNSERCCFLVTTSNIPGNPFRWFLNKNFKSWARKKSIHSHKNYIISYFSFCRNRFYSVLLFQFMSFSIYLGTINCLHMEKSEIITSFIFIITTLILIYYCLVLLILYYLLTFCFILVYFIIL